MDYLYDGSFEGLLTAIFYAYPSAESSRIYTKNGYAYNLLTPIQEVVADSAKADRVYNSIKDRLSTTTLRNVYYLYLSEIDNVETLILHYLKLCYTYGNDINLAKHHPTISDVDQFVKRVTLEAHRYLGFVRFKALTPLVYYATIEPSFNILPLIMKHFEKRFSDQYFIIHDLKRNTAIIYNCKEVALMCLNPEEVNALKKINIEDSFETLFKSYYQSATISERINLARRSHYMPKRYFKHLIEI